MDHNLGRACYEKNVSAEQSKTQTHAWFSSPHGNEERSANIKPSPCQGPSAVDTVVAARSHVSGLEAPQGFPRSRKLTTAAEFGRVFAKPLRSSDRYFTVLARANDSSGARLGLAISRRRAKRAVQRNRLKRLARETFRQLATVASCDFVVLAGGGAVTAGNDELRASLARHFERLNRLAAPTSDG